MTNKKSPPLSPAEMLKEELKKRNFSQCVFAEKLGETWTPPKVNDIVSGKRRISERKVAHLDLELHF